MSSKVLLSTMILASCILVCVETKAQLFTFKQGSVIKEFGTIAPNPTHNVVKGAQFRVAFDLANTDSPQSVNKRIDSLARFINMHADIGVKPERISLALVVHGGAIFNLLDDEYYKVNFGIDNPNKPLLMELMKNNVRVILCAQSAAARGFVNAQLIEGVEMELSAMTAHALLQQSGYTLNPF